MRLLIPLKIEIMTTDKYILFYIIMWKFVCTLYVGLLREPSAKTLTFVILFYFLFSSTLSTWFSNLFPVFIVDIILYSHRL